MQFQQFRQLTKAVLKSVEAGQTSEEALAQSALLLQKNPDVYTVWNYRRNVLSPELEVGTSCAWAPIAGPLRGHAAVGNL